ncbi:hypothetical protein NBRC10513v2_005569 [Rhodotorula toruloides]|uniref:Uncharacterized protein n=1 Tax=Rhodotorula toruloides TaxID=5286 RepID=A0A2T0A7Y9_RHOTO|nr:hypothetical protein AAT19DRAFT_14476 [Rhodotorula toruloides]
MDAQRRYELARTAIWNILVLAPARDARANVQFDVDVAKWRIESLEPLSQLHVHLEGHLNEGVFSRHLKALEQTVSACRQTLRARAILYDSQMPTTDQLDRWSSTSTSDQTEDGLIRNLNLKLLQDHADHQNYILPGFLGPFHGQYNSSNQHSLLKPEIARRVALMHGTTKGRWERQARAF